MTCNPSENDWRGWKFDPTCPCTRCKPIQDEIDKWKNAYWELMHNRLYSPEPMYSVLRENDNLRELNYSQATRIIELEFYLSFIDSRGDTLLIDYQKMNRYHRFIREALKEVHQPKGERVFKSLTESNWSKPIG